MARVSIYVSDELKARMTAVGDAINWSDVARPAFEQAIANHNHRKVHTMDTAIERLRASKKKAAMSDEDQGRSEGRAAASGLMEYDDLVRLSRIDTSSYIGTLHEALYRALDPDNDHNRAEFHEMWFTNEGADVSDDFVRGFIEGAQEFFDEVKDQI
jgi:hypothetical protein